MNRTAMLDELAQLDRATADANLKLGEAKRARSAKLRSLRASFKAGSQAKAIARAALLSVSARRVLKEIVERGAREGWRREVFVREIAARVTAPLAEKIGRYAAQLEIAGTESEPLPKGLEGASFTEEDLLKAASRLLKSYYRAAA